MSGLSEILVPSNNADPEPTRSTPTPLPDDLPPVKPLTIDLLPSAIGDFVFDVAGRQQCPPDFVAVTALTGLSACLGNKASVSPKQNDDWGVTPNLWAAIVGRPSTMKSPSMNAALRPIHKIQKNRDDDYQKELQKHKAAEKLALMDSKAADKEADKLRAKGDRNAAKNVLENDLQQKLEKPYRPRLIVNDATVEKLGEVMKENPTGLLLVRDEMVGWLSKLMTEEGQYARAFYLQCFNGNGSFVCDRIGRGTIHIEQATLSLVGGIQPSRLAPLVRGAAQGRDDDGLLQRLQLAVWPDDHYDWKWQDREPSHKAAESYEALFNKLAEYEGGGESYRFSEQAQTLFIEWMNELQKGARSGDHHPAFESYMLKLPETIVSIALIFEMATEDNSSIGGPSLAMALDWADYLLSHARRIYSLATDGGAAAAKLLISRRDKLDSTFSLRSIQRKGWAGLSTREEVEEAVELLVEHHHLVGTLDNKTGGRPSMSYYWQEG